MGVTDRGNGWDNAWCNMGVADGGNGWDNAWCNTHGGRSRLQGLQGP